MFIKCIFLILSFPPLFAEDCLNASERLLCKNFARELVGHLALGKITPQKALMYIEDPTQEEDAPDFVYEFMRHSFFTPLKIYRVFLLLDSSRDEPSENDDILGGGKYSSQESYVFVRSLNACIKGKAEEFLNKHKNMSALIDALVSLSQWNRYAEFSGRSMSIDVLVDMFDAVAAGLCDNNDAMTHITEFLEGVVKQTRKIRVPGVSANRLIDIRCEKPITKIRDNYSGIFDKDELEDTLKHPPQKDLSCMKLRFQNELAQETWCFGMLEALFGKDVAAPYICDSSKFETLKTPEGFEKIVQESEDFIGAHAVYVGVRSLSGKLAWEQILDDFLLSLKKESLKVYAKNALENVLEYIKEKDFEDSAQDVYMLSVIYALFDDLVGKGQVMDEAGALQPRTLDDFYYRNLLRNLLSNTPCADERGKVFQEIWASFVGKRLCLMKAPDTIYPANACLWAVKNKVGLIGCPFGFDVDSSQLSAHESIYSSLLDLMDHDKTHFNNNKYYCFEGDCPIYERYVELSKGPRYAHVSSATPYYNIFLMAVLLNDASVSDGDFFNLLETMLEPCMDLKQVFEMLGTKSLMMLFWRHKIHAALWRACAPLCRDMELELQSLSALWGEYTYYYVNEQDHVKLLGEKLRSVYERVLKWRGGLRAKKSCFAVS